MEKTVKDVKDFLSNKRIERELDDAELERLATEKLQKVIAQWGFFYSDSEISEFKGKLNDYISRGDVQKRRLYYYLLAMDDPSRAVPQQISDSGCTNMLCAMSDDDIAKLCRMIDENADDGAFGNTVHAMINKRGIKPSDVYGAAYIDRRVFSRVTAAGGGGVTRYMAWQVIVGLECTLEEADEVLLSAGYGRRNTRLDLTMEYFIRNRNYNIVAINEVLQALGLKMFSLDGSGSTADK